MKVLKHTETQDIPFILHLLPYLFKRMVPAFMWVTWLVIYYYCLAVFYNSCTHTLITDHSITGQFRLAGWSSGELCSPSSCPEQAQPWGQTGLVRSSPSWGIKPPKAWDSPTSLGPGSTTGGSSWRKGFSLSPACTSRVSAACATVSRSPAMHCCEEPSCVSSVPPTDGGDAVACPWNYPFSQLKPHQSYSVSLQGKGPQRRAILLRLKSEAVPKCSLMGTEKGQSLPSPGSRGHLLLTRPQAPLAFVDTWAHGWPQLSSLPATAQRHPPQLLPGPVSPSLHPCSTLPPWERAGWTSCSSPLCSSLLTAAWPSNVSTGPTQLDVVCKLGICALHPLLQVTSRDVKHKMDSMTQIT